jgi:DNA-binding SARP family transcriptional activator
MEFCLLGPLVVRSGGAPVLVPPGKQRAVLAVLLLNAGHVVGLDELTRALWGDEPPLSARVIVQNNVGRLRKVLGGRDRIRTLPGGYVITVAPGELDLARFERLLTQARTAAGRQDWRASAASAAQALALWRGEPLADTGARALSLRELPRLTEMRLRTVETRVEADLHCGRHREVIGELRGLAAEHPLRERVHGLLMLALYQDGRQGEALAAYRQARRGLVEELGAEPGAGLRELHQRILSGDPSLAAGPAPGGQDACRVVPRQLPAGIRHFTGRTSELAALTTLLGDGAEGPAAVIISAIDGTAGVGKTALALHWAHQTAERFPDGQLYVNLRGYDLYQPLRATDALAGLLHALGERGQDIPPAEEDRAARYRSLLAGRRMLVVLDNARSAEQVRPLLPATPSCVTVVTSRDSLAGLVARDGAVRLDLDLLPPAEAAGLLTALIGERAAADPDAVMRLAGQCCRLPLALRVAAELVTAWPATPLADLVTELADQQRRLDLLAAGEDARTEVRAVFRWSYRCLDADAARAFRLAGLHPGPSLDRYALAALAGTGLRQAGELLQVLARAHLIQPAGPGRYGMHDLLRAYAAEQAAAQDGEQEQRAALTRLFDHYLHGAATAMDALYPAEGHRRPPVDRPSTPAPPTGDVATARGWLDAERASLVAVAEHAAAGGWPGHATRLAAILFRYLDCGGHFPDAITIYGCARRAARQVGDHAAEATALVNLGTVDWRQGRYPQASRCQEQALALFRRADDLIGAGRALTNLGLVAGHLGRYPQSARYHEQALASYHQAGERSAEARALSDIASISLRQGRYQQATDRLGQALAVFRELGDRTGEAATLLMLGITLLREGRYPQATAHLEQGLALCCEYGNQNGQASALATLGDVSLREGRHGEAISYQRQALEMARVVGNRHGEAEALNGLGEALTAAGQPGPAGDHLLRAQELAGQIGDRYALARAHEGLGRARQASGDPGGARRHWEQALGHYAGLGAPEAGRVRVSLRELDVGVGSR